MAFLTPRNWMNSKCVSSQINFKFLADFNLEKMLWRSPSITRTRRYQSHGARARRGWSARWRIDRDWFLVSSYDIHSARQAGDDMDGVEKVWVCRGPNIDRIIFTTQVRLSYDEIWCTKPLPCRFDVTPDCSVELSPFGHQFFTELFEIFDKVVTFSFILFLL